MREIEMTAIVGDFDNGDGAKLWMDKDGIRIDDGNTANSVSVRLDWPVFDAMAVEVERYRAAVKAMEDDRREHSREQMIDDEDIFAGFLAVIGR